MSAPFASYFYQINDKNLSFKEKIFTIIAVIIFLVLMFSFLFFTEIKKAKNEKHYKEITVKTAVYHKDSDSTVITGNKDKKEGTLEIQLPGNHIKSFPAGTKIKYRQKRNH